MANPFSIEPANPLQALMVGVQGYDRGRASVKEADIAAGRQEAMGALQSGKDPSQALARLIGSGDIQGANVLAKLMETQQGQNSVYGTPIYVQNPDGTVGIGTFDRRSQWRGIGLPPGVQPMLPSKTVDTGTAHVPVPGRMVFQGGAAQPGGAPPQNDPAYTISPGQAARANAPQAGSAAPIQPRPVQTVPINPGGVIPKDVQGKEAAEVRGQAQGKAQANYPLVVSAVGTSLKLVNEMIKHPGRATATGLSSKLDPRNYIAGTDAANFDARAKQLEGRVFLDAFDQLRGAGAITEAEGQKATVAHGRLQRSQSDEEYVGSLNELRGILIKGLKVASLRAQGRFADADRELGAGVTDVTVTAPGQPNIDDLVKKYSQ